MTVGYGVLISPLTSIARNMTTTPKLPLLRWSNTLTCDNHNTPLVPPLFVAEQGSGVQIVDIRLREEATGVLGHVPGSDLSQQDPVSCTRNRRSKNSLIDTSSARQGINTARPTISFAWSLS